MVDREKVVPTIPRATETEGSWSLDEESTVAPVQNDDRILRMLSFKNVTSLSQSAASSSIEVIILEQLSTTFARVALRANVIDSAAPCSRSFCWKMCYEG